MTYNETLKDIEATFGFVPSFFKSAPEDAMVYYWPLTKKYGLEETEIPGKFRELIGLGIAGATHCAYCVYFHTINARLAGATDEEIAEVGIIAGNTSNWSTMLHTAGQDVDEFKKEMDRIVENVKAKMASQ